MMVEKTIAVLPGDGIGPEIMGEGIKVLHAVSEKYGHKFKLVYADFGAEAYSKMGCTFPADTWKVCNEADSILKGPVGLDAKGMKKLQEAGVLLENETIIELRVRLDTYANYRPVKLPLSLGDFSPLKYERLGQGLDIMMMRELVGGIYFGEKTEGSSTGWEYARDVCEYKRKDVERFAHAVFREARKANGKVTNVQKPNILATGRFWNKIVSEVAEKYPDVKLEQAIVDALSTQLCLDPSSFNGFIALENLQGDIITDQGGGVIGSLGLMPSACLNPETGRGYFEPAHGSAPGIAGKNIANPYSMIGSVAFMLEKSFGLQEEAADVWKSLSRVFSQGFMTAELYRPLTDLQKQQRVERNVNEFSEVYKMLNSDLASIMKILMLKKNPG